METEIVVKKKGQTTIPVRIRKKFKIEEGSRLQIIETDQGILLKPKKSFWDMVGAFPVDPAKKAEMDKQLYDLRHDENDKSTCSL